MHNYYSDYIVHDSQSSGKFIFRGKDFRLAFRDNVIEGGIMPFTCGKKIVIMKF
ncbi:MAG: hypothetical protein PHN41_05850 [Bacteroidales bacterium]|nr:hypothetical protein [Bacteroidales bacterium]